MKRALILAALATCMPAAAWAQSGPAAPPPPDPATVIAGARPNIAAAAARARAKAQTAEEKGVVEADLAFAADAAKRGAQAAFSAVAHPQARMFPNRAPVAMGPEGIAALFKDDTASWEWAPMEFAASGNLGATWGIALIHGKGEDGKPFAITTRYVSVWRKDASGAWKMWLDAGTPGPLPEVK